MHLNIHLFFSFLALLPLGVSLRIASNLAWIEHTPQPYAIKHFYSGTTAATLISGAVQDLASNPKNFDLAANAETQGLKSYTTHRNLRLIYIICEASYRIVADKRKGITKLADLKGKKIGTIQGTSAAIFIHNMMNSVGIKDSEYTTANGKVCMKTPCASDTLPAQLKAGTIDAFGVWEPAVELGVEALGANAVTFQNSTIYREVYSLYSTTDALNDPAKRKDIVEFVRALNKTLDVFTNKPKEDGVYDFVSKAVGVDVPVLEKVWEDHKWSGTWGGDLIEYIVKEDTYLASQDKRTVTLRSDLEKFLDTSVIDEL
jgi:ABC-type nitrate/sulfonate/bicarbonate transport system substrate-binding protein